MTSDQWREVERIYHSALAWEPGERTERLREACQGDLELQKEVESLLSADDTPLSMLDTPAWGAGAEDALAPGA